MHSVTRDERSGHIGVDVGATLSKIAHRPRPEDTPHFEFLPSANLELVADHVAAHRPARVGLTGGGATRLSPMLQCESQRVSEFDAWGNGATSFLAQMTETERREPSFLLVSLGTGTSVLLVSGGTATRIGGTGLGGGTVLGLGAALTGGSTFEELCSLAVEGSAARVDLRVSDIYAPDEIPLAGDLTASNFGMLARDAISTPEGAVLESSSRSDLAAGVMRLVGESVALICAGLAAATTQGRIVYGGSTIRDNPRLVEILTEVTTLCGRQACFPPNGEFSGALGALNLSYSRGG